MIKFSFIILMILPASFQHGQINHVNKPIQNLETDSVPVIFHYSDDKILNFLDSVNKLETSDSINLINFHVDSVFNSRTNYNLTIPLNTFKTFKASCKKGAIDSLEAKKILVDLNTTNYTDENEIPLKFYSFDRNKDDFNEYAVAVGYTSGLSWANDVYFFKENKLISKHTIFHRYGLELKYFKHPDGSTVFYYKENFGSGSGVWQFNYFFYKYQGNSIIPVLNMLENGNLNGWSGYRDFWCESSILKTNPLTLRFIYHTELSDSTWLKTSFIKDSSNVVFNWKNDLNKYVGIFNNKINWFKLMTYYLESNEKIFIKAYYKDLKEGLLSTSYEKHKVVHDYLNLYMNEVYNNEK